MGKLSTKEIFDAFYAENTAKTRPNVDKPVLYEYEQEIGKELIDMDVDELITLIKRMKQQRRDQMIPYMTTHSSYDNIISLFRGIFEWYIDNVDVIKNPFNDKKLKGKTAKLFLLEDMEPFTWDIVADVIRCLHRDKDEDNADYAELIMLLYYCGFPKAQDIVTMQEDMIDHRNQVVRLPGRTVRLNERCYTLLVKFHDMYEVRGWRGNMWLESWHNGYFKFIVRPSKAHEIDRRPLSAMCNMVNHTLARQVNDPYGHKINCHTLYYLGFYDYMCSRYGEEKVNEMILSDRNKDDVLAIMNAAREYGVDADNISHLKRNLYAYIKT